MDTRSTWLVTGGAGYIGSHIVRAFRAAGIRAVVVDDLSSGHADFVPDGAPFIRASILETDKLADALTAHEVSGVVHLAGFKYAGESVKRPLHTYTQNVTGVVSLLQAMAQSEVKNLVFSSSAATYGTPEVDLVTEDTPTHPESPYGRSKLIGEWLVADYANARELAHTSLRYFNVVGSGYSDLRDTSPHNLFPIVLDALVAGQTPKIFGDNYPTPDGTCVRDYVHVSDLAHSHVVAAQALSAGKPLADVYNLGSGDGVSVREIMSAMAEVTDIDFTPEVTFPRLGDPARVVASGEAAARDLDWKMRYSLTDMVASAWRARKGS